MKDLTKLCIHTITTKPLSFKAACEAYAKRGIGGVTIWQDAIQDLSVHEVQSIIRNNNLSVVSYCRGGFFANPSTSERNAAIENNKQMIEESAAVEAPLLVLVCGSHPSQSLETSRNQIRAAIEELLPFAENIGVKLAIEPLHPMYADDRSAINTLAQANDMTEQINSEFLGVAVDIYHLWWDPALEFEIKRCGRKNNLFAYHISDWLTPTRHMLLDRGLMGEGCIDIPQISRWVREAGFNGFTEVEIFSESWWNTDQEVFLNKITEAYSLHT